MAPDVVLGRDVRLAAFVNLYGCSIGDESTIGAFVEVQRGARIGRRCKISSHSFVCTGVEIEDEVFIGHGSGLYQRPPSARDQSGQFVKNRRAMAMERTVVRRRAAIGSGAIIMCGVEIGAGAMVGAGALVTHDVPAGALVAGSPARVRALAGAEE